MQAKDLRPKTEQELHEQLKSLRKDLKEVSISVLNRKEKNIKKPRNTRKEIARVLSVLKEKQILEAAAK
jgi:large subunit ribosomal protein L29